MLLLACTGTEYRKAGKGIKNRPELEWSNHFAGNFWWTTGEYWASLPPVVGAKRLDPEMHLFNNSNIKAGCLGNTGIVVGVEGLYRTYLPRQTVDGFTGTVQSCQ